MGLLTAVSLGIAQLFAASTRANLAARTRTSTTTMAEQKMEQIRARAKRMGFAGAPVNLASATALREIISTLKREKFDIVIIDGPPPSKKDA